MSFTLTQKETTLLKDLKEQEQLCADKYKKYAACAHDPQLSRLLNELSGIEQSHHQMLTDIESGQVPSHNSSGMQNTQFTAAYQMAETPEKKDDAYLCSDLLTTEKHVSALYNTCVFEFTTPEARKMLNHIQSEEQQHGEQLATFMKNNNMYN